MKPLRIPPMVHDVIQSALSALDGVEFISRDSCPHCGGSLQGYDTKKKQFAVLRENEQEHVVRVRIKRFRCRTCRSLSYADEPFYPGTRIGSPIVDLCLTLSKEMAGGRPARVFEALGIVIDRKSCGNFARQRFPEIRTADVFGMRLPFSILMLSSLAARFAEGGPIPGAEALAACGFPSAYRAPADFPLPKERDERDTENEEEKREPEQPEDSSLGK